MIWELVATGFFVGRSKFAPGTLGTLVAIPLIYLFAIKWWIVLIVGFLLFVLGVIASNQIISLTGEEDPEEVVIDEIAGFFVSFLFVTPEISTYIVGFIIFRIIDILKPFPVNLFEKLPEGWGVMADDIVAGLITSVILYFLYSNQ